MAHAWPVGRVLIVLAEEEKSLSKCNFEGIFTRDQLKEWIASEKGKGNLSNDTYFDIVDLSKEEEIQSFEFKTVRSARFVFLKAIGVWKEKLVPAKDLPISITFFGLSGKKTDSEIIPCPSLERSSNLRLENFELEITSEEGS